MQSHQHLGDRSDVVDGMSSLATSLAKDGLSYHGHGNGIDHLRHQSQAILYIRRNNTGMYHLASSRKYPADLLAAAEESINLGPAWDIMLGGDKI